MLWFSPVSIGYPRNSWQKMILKEFFGKLPRFTVNRVKEGVRRIEMGREGGNQAHYDEGKRLITIGQGIVHPKYFIEIVSHEIGHGLLDYPPQGVVRQKSNQDDYSDGFGLMIFYPNAVEKLCEDDPMWRIIKNYHCLHTFKQDSLNLDFSPVINHFTGLVLGEIQKIPDEETRAAVENFFRRQEKGYFRQYLIS